MCDSIANHRFWLWLLLAACLTSATVHVGTVVAVDVGDGPVAVTIDELSGHFWRARDRGDLGRSGRFTESDLLRDFMTSSDGYSISASVAGLAPFESCLVEVWSCDPLSRALFLSDWTANGNSVQQNYSQQHGTPLSNDDDRFSFTIHADHTGQIEILGVPQNSNDGVRVNGLRVSTVDSAVPEPGSLTLIAVGRLALIGWRSTRRDR